MDHVEYFLCEIQVVFNRGYPSNCLILSLLYRDRYDDTVLYCSCHNYRGLPVNYRDLPTNYRGVLINCRGLHGVGDVIILLLSIGLLALVLTINYLQ